MATALKLRADIKKYEAALKSKATPQSLKGKLEKQLEKAKSDLADMRVKKPTKKAKKDDLPKQFGAYKGSGVDIKKDSERPAKPIGKRKSKSGKTYYEYRLNRIDIKQPPKKYPKLEDGGMMAHGGEMHRLDESKMAKGGALEHGLKMGDKIWADQFWDNSVVVDNPKTGRAVVHLETGERKEQGKMEQGGETKSFNPTEFRNLLDKSIESLYTGLNEVELAMRYLEVHGMGRKATSIAQKIGIPSLKESIENLEEASSNI